MQDETRASGISTYHFGQYCFDVNRRELSLCTDAPEGLQPARLSSAEALILAHLLESHGEICDKETLLRVGWQGRPISPNSLNVAIANLRRHLLPSPQCADIRSTARKGYALHLKAPPHRTDNRQEAPSIPPPSEPAASSDLPPSRDPALLSPPASPARQHGRQALRSGLGQLLQARTLCYVNLALLLCLLLVAGLLRFEWLGVHCEQSGSHSLCEMEAKTAPTGPMPASTLTLISGHKVLTLSYDELDKEF